MKQTIIYPRTSTEEQNPELQRKDCELLAIKLNLQDYDVISEQQSAFKDVGREKFELIRSAIKRGEVKNLICWDLDRLYRNRKKLIEFFEFCKIYGCKIYSARQEWLESLNNIQEPFNEIMFNLMLQIMGWIAEEESQKKSQRVLNAVRREEGITKSYKGNKWGRKNVVNNRLREDILKLKEQGLTLEQISESVHYNKGGNKINPSISVIWKVLHEK